MKQRYETGEIGRESLSELIGQLNALRRRHSDGIYIPIFSQELFLYSADFRRATVRVLDHRREQ